MRYLLAFACVAAISASAAQETEKSAPKTPGPLIPSESYLVHVTEFRLKAPADLKIAPDNIAESFDRMLEEGAVELTEIVSLSAMEGLPGYVKIERFTSVVTGMTDTAQGRFPIRSSATTGTTIGITAMHKDDDILMELDYESSRFNGQGTEESAPELIKVQIQTTLKLKDGKAVLVGGTTSEPGSLLLVRIARK